MRRSLEQYARESIEAIDRTFYVAIAYLQLIQTIVYLNIKLFGKSSCCYQFDWIMNSEIFSYIRRF